MNRVVSALLPKFRFPRRELLKNRQLALGGLRFFSTPARVIIIVGPTGRTLVKSGTALRVI